MLVCTWLRELCWFWQISRYVGNGTKCLIGLQWAFNSEKNEPPKLATCGCTGKEVEMPDISVASLTVIVIRCRSARHDLNKASTTPGEACGAASYWDTEYRPITRSAVIVTNINPLYAQWERERDNYYTRHAVWDELSWVGIFVVGANSPSDTHTHTHTHTHTESCNQR